MTDDPLNLEPDAALGRALRTALDDPAGDAAFVAAAAAHYRAPNRRASDTLAAWSRWGVAAAAAVLIAAATLAVRVAHEPALSMDDALAGSDDVARTTLFTNDSSPGPELIYTNGEAE